MLKRIIFDLDNTLIMWKDEYIYGVKEAANLSNVDIDSKRVDEIVDSFDKKYKKITKEQLLEDINKICNYNLKIDFINNLFRIQKTFGEPDENVIQTLKYLSNKYELVVLTNYFREVQIERLKKAKIYNYFKEVYGGDYCIKPNKESYQIAISNYKKEECLMIGDNIEYDVEGAINFGLKAIACDYKNILSNTDKYIIIKDIKDLKNIL